MSPLLSEITGTTSDELASGYADLLLFNVFPYASAFLDFEGELNSKRAQMIHVIYDEHGYFPSELREVGGPDHIGLLLGILDHVSWEVILPYVIDWAPVFCLAVEREMTAHPFYRALAKHTRNVLFSDLASVAQCRSVQSQGGHISLETGDPEEDSSLRSLVRYLLCPARSGIFLSRARLGYWARNLGVALPFSSRLQVATSLFEGVGLAGKVAELLNYMQAEIASWEFSYQAWGEKVPAWAGYSKQWQTRTAATQRILADMSIQADEFDPDT